MKPQMRDNFGRFQKYATVNIKKQLEKIAKETEVNVSEVVAKKLKEVYKANVEASYGPRSNTSMEYEHTGIFLESIDVVIEDRAVKVKIRDDKQYPNGKLPSQVYVYLTKGTTGGGNYYFENPNNEGETLLRAYNYPTPAHLFEEHTKVQMKGFLDTLETDIKKGKYSDIN